MESLKATVPPQEIESTIAEFCPEPIDDVSALNNCMVVVAELDDQIIGYAGINLATGFIFFMFVAPEFMRRGIGRQLLFHLEQMAV
jgi:GNAT superfamily N-acetyltransferase